MYSQKLELPRHTRLTTDPTHAGTILSYTGRVICIAYGVVYSSYILTVYSVVYTDYKVTMSTRSSWLGSRSLDSLRLLQPKITLKSTYPMVHTPGYSSTPYTSHELIHFNNTCNLIYDKEMMYYGGERPDWLDRYSRVYKSYGVLWLYDSRTLPRTTT